MSLRNSPIGSTGNFAKSIGIHSTLVGEPYKLTLVGSNLTGSNLVVNRYLTVRYSVDRNRTDQYRTDRYKAGFKKAIISYSQFKKNPPFSKDEFRPWVYIIQNQGRFLPQSSFKNYTIDTIIRNT